MSESAVIKQVRAILERDPRINLHHYPVSIAMVNGDLILTGQVESIAAKKLALLEVAEIHGVERIVDRLTVASAEKWEMLKFAITSAGSCSMSRHLRDVRWGLPAPAVPEPEPGLEARGSIMIEVQDGVVTLNGEVPSLTHKRLAGVLAWWVPGLAT